MTRGKSEKIKLTRPLSESRDHIQGSPTAPVTDSDTDKLGLETVGLKPGDWLDVGDTCLVNGVDGDGEWLYAIGDINHRALLTHRKVLQL